MSSTATELPVSPSAPAPREPDPRILEVRVDEVEELLVSPGVPESPFRLHDAGAGRVAERPASGPIVSEMDREGVCIVQDVLGAVYGAGASYEEARAEFDAALDDHLRFLRAHRDELDERLQQQLPALERLFPGR